MSCKACAEIPVVPSNYTPKGRWEEIAGLKTYVQSSTATPTTVLIGVYDVFGLHPSTLQGVDRLAELLPNTAVVLPDFFKGDALSLDLVPPDTDEKKARMTSFLSGPGNVAGQVPALEAVVPAVKAKFGVTKVAAYGLCWGGMMTAKASAAGTGLVAAGTVHPGRPNADVAKAITVPYVALLSKEDGEPEDVRAYMDVLNAREGSYAEQYADMHHGWAGARADLSDEANVKEYQRAYAKLAEFFGKHLA